MKTYNVHEHFIERDCPLCLNLLRAFFFVLLCFFFFCLFLSPNNFLCRFAVVRVCRSFLTNRNKYRRSSNRFTFFHFWLHHLDFEWVQMHGRVVMAAQAGQYGCMSGPIWICTSGLIWGKKSRTTLGYLVTMFTNTCTCNTRCYYYGFCNDITLHNKTTLRKGVIHGLTKFYITSTTIKGVSAWAHIR